ncbi:energy-coupling factor transporter ATP-binding protein EcfA2 [Pseudomonas sp. JAI115]|uniref:ATP-binding protein n=1 Tax=Pseudomonas sp. JAI115 TaxID=2723061 RepID=UPI00160D4C93|nr:ATP-binding protein [Pseudomonas sp. JAI115]MBB6153726.1 energy-coupling factor transporter ATP-binding protein EcfA2 [Pseudomonas sp. JAI115]
MQNQLKTAIRFDDFLAVFGAQGVVAMAWWLGAKHGAQIRTEEQGFPFLYVTGPAGSGKTTLLSYLSALNGVDSVTCYAPAYATPQGLARILANAGEQPVILEDGYDAERRFDWSQLAPLYDGGSVSVSQSEQAEITFKGTLVISATPPLKCSQAFTSRTVHIDLNTPHTANSRHHAQAMQQFTAEQANKFSHAVQKQADQTINMVRRLAPAYAASLYDNHSAQPTARAAQIGGLLMALVDVLSLLLNLSDEQRRKALAQVEQNVVMADLPY